MTLTKAEVLAELDSLKELVQGLPEDIQILHAQFGTTSYIQLYKGIGGVVGDFPLKTRNHPNSDFLELRVRKAGFDIIQLADKPQSEKVAAPAL